MKSSGFPNWKTKIRKELSLHRYDLHNCDKQEFWKLFREIYFPKLDVKTENSASYIHHSRDISQKIAILRHSHFRKDECHAFPFHVLLWLELWLWLWLLLLLLLLILLFIFYLLIIYFSLTLCTFVQIVYWLKKLIKVNLQVYFKVHDHWTQKSIG